MSYNTIDTIVLKNVDFRIEKKTADHFLNIRGILCESHCFENIIEDSCRPNYYLFEDFYWCGTGSGRHFDVLEKQILPDTKGYAELIFTWEDGEVTGIKVDEGVITKHEVIQALGDEI